MSLLSALKKQAPVADPIELSDQPRSVVTGPHENSGSNDPAGLQRSNPMAVEPPHVKQGEERLIDLDDDAEKGKVANPDSDSPLPTPRHEAKAEDGPIPVVATDGGKKKPGLLAMFNRDNRGALIIFGLSVVSVMAIAAVVALSIVSSKDAQTIKKLEADLHSTIANPIAKVLPATSTGLELHGRGEYVDGISAVLNNVRGIELAKHAVEVVSTTSDTCDDDATTVLPIATAIFNMTMTSTSTLVNVTGSPIAVSVADIPSTVVATDSLPVVTPFLTTSESVSMPDATTPASSSALTSSSTTSSSQTCGEWGDGAGPCTRPYGRPNTTPASILSAESVMGGTETVTIDGTMALLSSVAFTSSIQNATSLAAAMSGSDASQCGPTATVFVTITASQAAADNMTIANAGSTVFGTFTQVSLVTSTIRGSDGPLTTTETALWSNNTTTSTEPSSAQIVTAINGTLTTLSVANWTLTLPSTVYNNGSATSTAGPRGATNTVPVASGGEQAAPKPLGASTTGNGVYCTVMLVALIALLV